MLLAVWGCASGLFNALLTILPQILCPYGYTDVRHVISSSQNYLLLSPSFPLQKESGLWGALMIFSGMIGATLGGIILDFSKLFKEVAVVSYSLAILSFIWFYEVSGLYGA